VAVSALVDLAVAGESALVRGSVPVDLVGAGESELVRVSAPVV